MAETRLVLPPEGTYLRDYTLLSYAMIAERLYLSSAGFTAYISGDTVVFKGVDDYELCAAIASYYEKTLDLVKKRVETQDIRYPAPHFNDVNTLGKALGVNLRARKPRYNELFGIVVEKALGQLGERSGCSFYLRELGAAKQGRGALILGDERVSKTIAPLQPLKLEKYKHAKTYSSFHVKGDVKMTLGYAALPLAAWLLSYMGFHGKLVFAMPTTDDSVRAIADPGYTGMLSEVFEAGTGDALAEKLYGEKGYYTSVARALAGRGTRPLEAYLLVQEIELMDYLSKNAYLPIRVLGVYFDGRRFTLADDLVVDPGKLYGFATRLSQAYGSERLAGVIVELATCAIRGYEARYSDYCRRRYGDSATAIRMVKLLYAAATGSMNPYRALYMMSRLSPPPENGFVPPLRDRRVVEGLLWVLRR